MRRIIVVLITVLFCAGISVGYAAEMKLGYINLKKVMDNYEKVKDGEDELLKKAENKNEQREKLVAEIKNLREKIDLLNDKQKEKKQEELNEKLKQLQEITYQTRTGLQQDRDEKLRDIMKEVGAVIEEYGQSRGYNIIIDDTLLFYKDTNLDVTDDVIKVLNQRYK